MSDDTDKDAVIRELGHEVAELRRCLLEQRQACCEENGRLRVLLNDLHDSLPDAGGRARVRNVLAEMSGDLSSLNAEPMPTHESKTTLH